MTTRVFSFISALLATAIMFAPQAQALERNGTGTYSELGSKLYIGSLFLESPSQSPGDILEEDQAKRLEVRFSDDMSRRSWTQYWTQSIAINNAREDLVASGDEMSQVLSAFKSDMKQGDRVELIYTPEDGTSLVVNGTTLASGKSARLFNLFLSTWIGSVPPSSDFKNAVLGKADSSNAYARFQSLSPTEERIATVENWAADKQEEKQEEEASASESVAESDSAATPPSGPQTGQGEETQASESEEETSEPEQVAEQQQTEEEEQAQQQKEEQAQQQTEEQAQQRQAQREAEQQAAEEARRKAEEEAAREQEAEELAALSVEGVEEREESEEQVDLSVEAILAQQDYTTNIITRIYESVRYPRRAVDRNQEGGVRASMVINRDGTVRQVQVVEGSEYDILNQAARDAIEEAAPFPPIPDEIREDSLEMMIPVSFKLN